MKIYTQYISNFSNSTARLREMSDDLVWMQWKQAQEMKLGGMTLQSLLIMPVQRVPRYILLLRDLFKHTWSEHPDYANLQQAASQMEELTQFLNMKKQEAENLNRLAALATFFKGKIDINLAEAHRRFIREDRFAIDTKVYLFNDIIIVLTEQTQTVAEKKHLSWSGRRRSSHGTTMTSKADVHNIDRMECIKTDFGFLLRSPGVHTVILEIHASNENTEEVLEDWIQSFNEIQKEKLEKEEAMKAAAPRASGVTLTRSDSLISLQKSLDMLHNHINSLDAQIKGVKNKKEKKQFSKLKQALDIEASEVDKKLSAKAKQRYLRERARSIKEEAVRSASV